MNAATRKQIATLVAQLEEIKGSIDAIKDEVSSLQSEEQDKFDNLTEGLQQAESGQKIEAAANALQECDGSFDEVESAIDAILEYLNTASE